MTHKNPEGETYGFFSVVDMDGRVSSLEWSDKHPYHLRVVGVLPHGSEIRPKTIRDAQKIGEWFTKQADRWGPFAKHEANPDGLTEEYDDGVPNLDAMNIDELREFYTHHDRGQNSKELFPDGGAGTRNATKDLASYALNKATAMPLRAKGNVRRAEKYEAIADRIYDDDLPEWAKW